jgi:hypothetical protein
MSTHVALAVDCLGMPTGAIQVSKFEILIGTITVADTGLVIGIQGERGIPTPGIIDNPSP